MDLRREHALRHRHFKQRMGEVHQSVIWYPLESLEKHPVYDVPGEEVYGDPRYLRIMWAYDEESSEAQYSDRGRSPRRALNICIETDEFYDAGLDPDSLQRQKDVVIYDGAVWDVDSFGAHSYSNVQDPLVANRESLVSIRCYERFEWDHPWGFEHALFPNFDVLTIEGDPLFIDGEPLELP